MTEAKEAEAPEEKPAKKAKGEFGTLGGNQPTAPREGSADAPYASPRHNGGKWKTP